MGAPFVFAALIEVPELVHVRLEPSIFVENGVHGDAMQSLSLDFLEGNLGVASRFGGEADDFGFPLRGLGEGGDDIGVR